MTGPDGSSVIDAAFNESQSALKKECESLEKRLMQARAYRSEVTT